VKRHSDGRGEERNSFGELNRRNAFPEARKLQHAHYGDHDGSFSEEGGKYSSCDQKGGEAGVFMEWAEERTKGGTSDKL